MCQGFALSNRLARAFRSGHDRSHGVRHAGYRLRSGSVPEVVDHGVTDFIADGEVEAVQAAKQLGELDRRQARACFEQRFTPSGWPKNTCITIEAGWVAKKN